MSASVWTPSGFLNAVSSAFISFLQRGTGATTRTVQAKLRGQRVSIDDFGAVADGVTNCNAALTLVVAVTSGRFHFEGPGTYVLDAVPNVFAYPFTAGDSVTLKIAGVDYDVSNAFCGALRYTTDSPVLTSIRHAETGNVLVQFQNGNPGTATYFYRTVKVTTDSHAFQLQPATNGGSTDVLFQRSTLNADPAGNRFNITFEENNDRLLLSYATTASGLPSFDSFCQVYAGLTPKLDFPAVQGRWGAGIEISTRATGNFGLETLAVSTTRVDARSKLTPANILASYDNTGIGFLGAAPSVRQAVAVNATDLATAITLVNDIKAKLITKGLIS